MAETTFPTTNSTPSVKTDCGCGGHAHEAAHVAAHEDCPCAKRRKRQRLIIGGIILVVLGVAAYGAYRMGYFDKALAYFKK